MDGHLTAGELLRLVTLLTRDSAAAWTLATAVVSLLAVSTRQPRRRTVVGGVLVWFVALGGYLSPVQGSHFFDQGAVYFMLVLALALWVLVLAHLATRAAGRLLLRSAQFGRPAGRDR